MTTLRVLLIFLALVLLVLVFWLDWGVEDYATRDCARDMPPLVPNFWRGEGATDVTFLAFGDSQFYHQDDDRNLLNVRALNAAETLLRWTPEPFGLDEPLSNVRGVIIAGDLTQNGRDGRFFESDEYQDFIDCYGLCGNRTLKYPVYEGYGNHDYYIWNNPLFRLYDSHPVANAVSVRNACRPGILDCAPRRDGHYSWEWDNVHFVQLNLKPSDVPGVDYGSHKQPVPGAADPRRALSFLKDDLAKHVAGSGKPVVIVAHYGFHPHWDFDGWWTEAEADTFYEAIRDYNVIAYLHGHNHGTETYEWRGIRVLDLGAPYYTEYNPDGRGHFTVVRITNDFLYAADAAWDPKNPDQDIRFPAGWQVKVPLH